MDTARLAAPLVAVLATSAFSGCYTIQALHSPPPLSKIVLPKPFEGDGFMFHITMPAGDYFPAYEDGTNYYYQASSKMTLRTIATEYKDGGFYIDGRTKALRGWWHTDDEGNQVSGALGAPPEFRAVP
jgi:hypothetical protein